jgi:hypothetical protein
VNLRPSGVHAGIAVDLTDDLRALVVEVLQAEAAAHAAEADRICKVTALAQAANGRRLTSGRSALAACAESLRVSRQTLQAYVTLATRWSCDRLRTLLGRRDANGTPISFTQLLEIARAPSPMRREIIEEFFGTGATRESRLSPLGRKRGAKRPGGARSPGNRIAAPRSSLPVGEPPL